MSIHQYIGARYVPYYYENSLDPTSTEWEPNVTYEPLTVVTLPNQHSYISKKLVPDTIGSPALNAEYWKDTGYDNAYIQSLQDQIDIINNTDLPGIQNQIDTINNTDLPGIRNDINDINDNLFGSSSAGKAVYIGDSFGNDIVSNLANFGFTITYNNSVGGAGFNNDIYKSQMETLYPSISDPNAIKYVIAIGGTNDTDPNRLPSWSGYIKNFCIKARELFPNARILIGFVSTLYRVSDLSLLDGKGWTKYLYMQGVCDANVNAEFIDNLTEAIADCYWAISGDKVHPTSAGYTHLAHIVYQAIKRQNATVPSPLVLTQKSLSNTVNGVTLNTVVKYHNDGRGNPCLIIPAQTIATNVTLDHMNIYRIATTAEIPLPVNYYIRKNVRLDATHVAMIAYSGAEGIRFYGGVGGTNIAGTYSSLDLAEDVIIPLTIY